MFRRLDISIPRAFFWLCSMILYWFLIYLAWWDTRFQVYKWAGVLAEFGASRKEFSAIMENLNAIEAQAWADIAKAGPVPVEYVGVAVVMAIVLFIVPFIVRKDTKSAVTGIVTLPLAVLLCYFYSSLLNVILGASITGGLHIRSLKMPGPDFFIFLIHPLYLAIPPMLQNLWGSASQVLYLLFVASVLTTPNRYYFIPGDEEMADDDEAEFTDPNDPEGDKATCLMELDRLTRLIEAKTSQPGLAEALHREVSAYLDAPEALAAEITTDTPYYRIVLTEACKDLRRMLDETPLRPGAKEAFAFITDEMERMEYVTADEAKVMRLWMEAKVRSAG